MLAAGVLALAILAISAGATLFRETLISALAWENQLELERGSNSLQADIAPDGSLWVLVESEDPYSAKLQQLQEGTVIQTVKLADDPLLRAALERNDGEVGSFSSMTIDSSGKLWLNMGSSETVSWDGERWSVVTAATAGETRVEEMEFGAGIVWALLSNQSGLLAIDPISGESREYSLEFEFSDGPVELLPDMISAAHDGGIVVAGVMNPGGIGLLSLDLNGNPSVLTFIPDPKSVGARKIQHVSGDAKGQIHLIFEFAEPCSNGFRRVKSGTRLANALWVWRDLAYEANCSLRAGSDSIAVDPLGRTWVGNNKDGVHVFEAPSRAPLDAPLEPSMLYTEDNSGFNGRDLNQMRTGQILAASSFGRELVSIDATQEELPAPLPAPLVWLLANSSLIYIFMIPLIVISVWRLNKANFGKE